MMHYTQHRCPRCGGNVVRITEFNGRNREITEYACLQCSRRVTPGVVEGLFQCSICRGYVAGTEDMRGHLMGHTPDVWQWPDEQIAMFFRKTRLTRMVSVRR